jgi:hypothetical protein
MQKEVKNIDITDIPDLLKLAEEVRESNQPHLLKRGQEAIALLSPVESPAAAARPAKPRARTTSPADPLWNIIGIADADPPTDGATDVSSHKSKYLAEAYYPKKP